MKKKDVHLLTKGKPKTEKQKARNRELYRMFIDIKSLPLEQRLIIERLHRQYHRTKQAENLQKIYRLKAMIDKMS